MMTANRKRDGIRRGDDRSRGTGVEPAQIGEGVRARGFRLATDSDEASAAGRIATQFAVDDLPEHGTEYDDADFAAGGYRA